MYRVTNMITQQYYVYLGTVPCARVGGYRVLGPYSYYAHGYAHGYYTRTAVGSYSRVLTKLNTRAGIGRGARINLDGRLVLVPCMVMLATPLANEPGRMTSKTGPKHDRFNNPTTAGASPPSHPSEGFLEPVAS